MGLRPLKYAFERNYKTRHIRWFHVTHIRQAFFLRSFLVKRTYPSFGLLSLILDLVLGPLLLGLSFE